jgi:hypothetical protein
MQTAKLLFCFAMLTTLCPAQSNPALPNSPQPKSAQPSAAPADDPAKKLGDERGLTRIEKRETHH